MGSETGVMESSESILEVECKEPDGKVVRSVRLTKLSIERMGFLWDKLKGFDVLFNDFVRGDFEAFVNHFIVQVDGEPVPTGIMWDVDDVGMFFLNNIRPLESAEAHFVFWDKRFRGREVLCLAMLAYAFDTFKFRRIELRVPLYAYHTMNAVERIGFVKEGRMRKAILYKGDWFDVNMYSILPEDILEKEVD